MKKEQLIKILKVAIISTIIMLVAEAIFSIPAITNWFGDIIKNSSGVWVWVIIWVIMFLQVTILNIPAYVILSASISIGIETLSIVYIAVVLSAYMAGCLFAYWIGYKFGRKAVKWCAGSDEDYNKWSKFLNKKGKLWYFLTVLFPFFPDDLLCFVAGSVKFNFWWYTLINFVGRGIGLVTMLFTLKFITNFANGFPIMLIVWAVALVAEIIIYFILKAQFKNKKNNVQENETKNEKLEQQKQIKEKNNEEQNKKSQSNDDKNIVSDVLVRKKENIKNDSKKTKKQKNQ